jgi:hypothetical protein
MRASFSLYAVALPPVEEGVDPDPVLGEIQRQLD